MKKPLFAPLFFCLALTALTTLSATAAPEVDSLDPAVLKELDAPGAYSLATLLGATSTEKSFLEEKGGDLALTRLKVLRLARFHESGNAAYRTLADRIRADVEELKSKSGEKMAFSSEEAEKLAPAGNVARHFDPFWLTSARAGFPLIAVVNRLDRRDQIGGCGEVRFVYRLAYYKAEKKGAELLESRSTLPLFLNAIFEYAPGTDCRAVAANWDADANGAARDPAAFAEWLRKNPLEKSRLRFKQLELNMQIVRFPSGQKTDFGGQAIYLFRIFQEKDGALVSVPLESTPDVAAIESSPALKEDLVRQIRANLGKIDQGLFVLENTDGKMLTSRALSFSTSGRGRLANKPFTALFGPGAEALKGIDLAGLKHVKSAQGLVERLNNHTCTGCHQSAGTAGFQLLGLTGTLNSAFNQVVLPFSPHYYAERIRRSDYVRKVAEGIAPNAFRPHSIFPAADWSGAEPTFHAARVRDLCLPDDKHLGALPCASGLTCRQTVENKALGMTIGECVQKPNTVAGHVCRDGKVSTAKLEPSLGDLYNLKSFRDTIDISKTFSDVGACGKPEGGVPLGRNSKGCDSNTPAGRLEFVDSLKPGQAPPKEMCAMRGGPQFDECAKSKDPPDCLAKTKIARGLLDTCSPGNFCREDYICQQLPTDISRLYSGKEKETVSRRIAKLGELGIGFCVPNYFIFNMRADGHIIPEGRSGR